jgi:adenylosuccinate synthase
MREMLRNGINVVLDGQWGSTGKGKLCGLLGREQPAAVMSSFGPNAGHTWMDDDGKSIILKALPSSACTANEALVFVAPDSVIKLETLMKEVEIIGKGRVFVHPRCAVVTDEDKASAEITGRHLAGTMQGTGHAIARKILRIKGTKMAGDVLPASMVMDTCKAFREIARAGKKVIFEMSQGWDLSINHGLEFPYLTSRDITIGAAINSMGVSHRDVAQVIGSIRTMPIRVGNVEGGYSGGCWQDQHELTWEDVTVMSESPKNLIEHTTVTKRVRRVFTYSPMQVAAFCNMNKPDWLFLNFIQYISSKDAGKTEYSSLTQESKDFIANVQSTSRTRVLMVGTGAKDSEVIYP